MHDSSVFRWRLAAGVAAVCAGLVFPLLADDGVPEAEALQEALSVWQDGLQQVSSIVSDFVQEKQLALFQDALTIQGRLFITTDGHFAWETHWPVRYKLVVADGRIRQWDEETGRVQTISMRDNPAASAIHAQMSVWFSGRYEDLADTYALTLASEQPVVFVFSPLEGTPAADYLETVQVRLLPDGHYLDRIRIVERSGDTTSITFTNTVLNQALPASTWDVRALTTNALPQTNAVRPVHE